MMNTTTIIAPSSTHSVICKPAFNSNHSATTQTGITAGSFGKGFEPKLKPIRAKQRFEMALPFTSSGETTYTTPYRMKQNQKLNTNHNAFTPSTTTQQHLRQAQQGHPNELTPDLQRHSQIFTSSSSQTPHQLPSQASPSENTNSPKSYPLSQPVNHDRSGATSKSQEVSQVSFNYNKSLIFTPKKNQNLMMSNIKSTKVVMNILLNSIQRRSLSMEARTKSKQKLQLCHGEQLDSNEKQSQFPSFAPAQVAKKKKQNFAATSFGFYSQSSPNQNNNSQYSCSSSSALNSQSERQSTSQQASTRPFQFVQRFATEGQMEEDKFIAKLPDEGIAISTELEQENSLQEKPKGESENKNVLMEYEAKSNGINSTTQPIPAQFSVYNDRKKPKVVRTLNAQKFKYIYNASVKAQEELDGGASYMSNCSSSGFSGQFDEQYSMHTQGSPSLRLQLVPYTKTETQNQHTASIFQYPSRKNMRPTTPDSNRRNQGQTTFKDTYQIFRSNNQKRMKTSPHGGSGDDSLFMMNSTNFTDVNITSHSEQKLYQSRNPRVSSAQHMRRNISVNQSRPSVELQPKSVENHVNEVLETLGIIRNIRPGISYNAIRNLSVK